MAARLSLLTEPLARNLLKSCEITDMGLVHCMFTAPDFAGTDFANPKVMAGVSEPGWLIEYHDGENAT